MDYGCTRKEVRNFAVSSTMQPIPHSANTPFQSSTYDISQHAVIWVLIKIKVSEAATIADQPRINRDPNGVNRGRVLS